MKVTHKHLRKHVHNRVVFQLVMAAAASLILLFLVIRDALRGDISLGLVALTLFLGIAVGIVVGKIYQVKWSTEAKKVVMNMDKTSFFLVGVYIVVRYFSNQLAGQYIHGETLSAFSFSTLSGIMLGRLYVLWGNIERVLKEQRKI